MRILCTGAAGFIGNNLVNELLYRGDDVYGLDIIPGINHRIQTIECPVQMIHKIGMVPDIIFHLAAQSRVQPSFKDPVGSFDDNVKGTLAVLEFARQNGCKVIYAGSSSKHHNPYDSPYAATKMMGEEVCKLYRESYGVDVDIARFYNVYGPGEALDPVNGNVIGIWRHNVEKGIPIKVVGDGEQRRDFTHVDDIVDGLIKISDAVVPHEDAWELGTGRNVSINDLATLFHERSGCLVNYIDDQKGNYRETLNTNTDAYDRLGWSAKKDVIKYIESLEF